MYFVAGAAVLIGQAAFVWWAGAGRICSCTLRGMTCWWGWMPRWTITPLQWRPEGGAVDPHDQPMCWVSASQPVCHRCRRRWGGQALACALNECRLAHVLAAEDRGDAPSGQPACRVPHGQPVCRQHNMEGWWREPATPADGRRVECEGWEPTTQANMLGACMTSHGGGCKRWGLPASLELGAAEMGRGATDPMRVLNYCWPANDRGAICACCWLAMCRVQSGMDGQP